MSDDEWDRLRDTFQREQRAMPNVVTRARNDRRRAAIGRVAAYAVLALLALLQAPALGRARTPLDLAAPLFLVGAAVAVGAALHLALRGAVSAGALTPAALLDELERRHAGRRKLLRALRWIGAYVLGGLTVAAVHGWIAAGRVDAATAIGLFVILAYAIVTHVLLDRWARRRIARDLAEVAEARRLLAGDGDEGAR